MGYGDVKEGVVGLGGAFEAWHGFRPFVDAFFEYTDVLSGVIASSCQNFQANHPSSVPLFREDELITLFVFFLQCLANLGEDIFDFFAAISIMDIDQMRTLFDVLNLS